MFSPSNPEYIETKEIVLGKRSMSRKATVIAEAIYEKYKVDPINIYFDRTRPDNRPRLSVIFQTRQEARKFGSADGFNFDQEKQSDIVSMVKRASVMAKLDVFLGQKLLVVFSDFNSVAREDVYHSVPKREIYEAVESFIPNLWHIRHMIAYPSIFLPTDADVKNLDPDLKDQIRKELFSLVKHYDFCDCFGRGMYVLFDSKENFDTNYESNWTHYCRDH